MYVYVLLYIRVREKGKITWYVLKYKRIDCFLKKLGKLNRLFNVFYVFRLYDIFFFILHYMSSYRSNKLFLKKKNWTNQFIISLNFLS